MALGGHNRGHGEMYIDICILFYFFVTLTEVKSTCMIYKSFPYYFQNDYSQYGIQAFSNQFKQEGGCLAFHLTIPKSPTEPEIRGMVEKLQSSTAQVVVVFATEGQLVDLFEEVSLLTVYAQASSYDPT